MEKVQNDEKKELSKDYISTRRRVMNFQTEMIDIEILKTKEAYGYYYADLPSIMKIILPKLNEHGLGFYHNTSVEPNIQQNLIITTLFNFDDETDMIVSATLIDKEATLAKMNRFMVEGSAITYFRRYHLTTMLGLTTDEDSDAGGKRSTKQKPGRSVEAATKSNDDIDFVEIFKNLVKKKDEEQVRKTLESYKKQIDNTQSKKIEIIIKEAYENK